MNKHSKLKPIETKFKGYRFRSRLEARWAVFFDALRLQYEYEIEGFSLPSGEAYLPDFLLRDMGIYVEVKPKDQLELRELKKLSNFVFGGEYQLLLILGSPTKHEMLLIDKASSSVTEYEEEYEKESDIVSEYLNGLRDFSRVTFGRSPLHQGWTLVFSPLPPPLEVDLQRAFLKAKQARFEFGEEG
ncbi:MAG: hypothetical protein WBK37_05740 [Kiritimatiellia bacterium]|jgi:hypothetical protein|nr:hypothetical protein [Kiritimatiellia bacterium]MBP9573075.1 hypothetical protein [Kiritimatiellia bacterium]